MNCLNSLLSKDEATAEAAAAAGMGVHDTTEVGVGVPLPSVGATPASSSLPVGRKLQQELRQAQGPAIILAERGSKR